MSVSRAEGGEPAGDGVSRRAVLKGAAVGTLTLDVTADPARRAGALDSLGREHLVGLGCAVENLLLEPV